MSAPREQARNGLRLDGLGKPLDLNVIDWHIRRQNPSASPSTIQNETLELIRCPISRGSDGGSRAGRSDCSELPACRIRLLNSLWTAYRPPNDPA